MRQLVQSLKDGSVELLDVPTPQVAENHVLIRSQRSVISAGTERMIRQFGEANWVQRATSQPERVAQVVDKIRSDGIAATYESIQRRIDEPVLLGYANAGEVVATGHGVSGLAVGDRVASTGHHAEFVLVPIQLVHKIPANVDSADACFAPLVAIALHAFRLSNVQIGARVAVVGLGLLGRLAAQISRSAGCSVVGYETDPDRAAAATAAGIEVRDPTDDTFDAVLVATNGTDSTPLNAATKLCRRGGSIVLVGTSDVALDRNAMFEKEIVFQVSRSLGPGRYSRDYEEHARDFEPSDVRWTEGRNIAAALQLISDGGVRPSDLEFGTVPFSKAPLAYNQLSSQPQKLTYVLRYPADVVNAPSIPIPTTRQFSNIDPPRVAVIGAGNFAAATLLSPMFDHATVMAIASRRGVSAARLAEQFGIPLATTDTKKLLERPDIDAVAIITPHHTHAQLAINALQAGKHVYVEKPAAIRSDELAQLRALYEQLAASDSPPALCVGTNRRFAPLTMQVKKVVAGRRNRHFICRMNEARLPDDHWLLDARVGGGVVVGTMVHYIDWVQAVSESPIESWSASAMDSQNVHITLKMQNDDVATLIYMSNGNRALPKERLEVICNGEHWVIDDFRVLRQEQQSRFLRRFSGIYDKGHNDALARFFAACKGEGSLPTGEMFDVAQVAIDIQNSL